MKILGSIYIIGSVTMLWLFSCGIYSFKDSSISPDVKTLQISDFLNKAAIVNASLANNITNKFKNKIQQQTKLLLVNGGRGDYEISGYISQYNVTTSGISGTKQVAQNQLTLSVHVQFVNNLADKLPDVHSFETDISLSKQYSSQLSLQQAEQAVLPELTTEMVNLLFNKIFSNW